MIEFKEKKGIN